MIAPRPGTLSHVSVSQLEVIDAELQHLLEPEVDQVPLNEVLSADEATQLGTITHAVIERLEPEKPEQAPPIVAAVLAEQPPQVREKLQPLVERQISAWYASELCQTLKQTRVHYRELDFLLHWPPGAEADSDQAVTVTGSIDALVQTESGDWMLFDYKTGSRMARMSAEQLILEYEFQLGVYTLAVEQLLGARPASIGLAVVQDSVRYIECDLDAGRLEQISRRLTQAVSSLLQPSAAAESR